MEQTSVCLTGGRSWLVYHGTIGYGGVYWVLVPEELDRGVDLLLGTAFG